LGNKIQNNSLKFELKWKHLDTSNKYLTPWVISGFPREVDENRSLLGYYAGSNGNPLPPFQDNLPDKLSRKRGEKLPLLAA
jgi:hypothetical protein